MGADWQRQLSRDLQPVMLPNDRAIVLGLVLTELVINAQKHAYGGAPGPLGIILAEDRNLVRLVVTDQGVGTALPRKGYGSRMMQALVSQIGGTLDYESANPGTRATLTAPVEAPRH
jgi:two-component system, chemotaxis family, sensor kinase Cph1